MEGVPPEWKVKGKGNRRWSGDRDVGAWGSGGISDPRKPRVPYYHAAGDHAHAERRRT